MTASEKLIEYHAALDNHDTDLADRLWREYCELCAAEMEKKEAA